MASKIGVYFDVQNIGGGLDVEALAEQVRSKWSDLTPVVKVLPMLSVAEDEVRADIEANGLDGVLFCGASPRDEATPWQLPVQVEHVNLREQCVLAYKNPDGSAVSGAAPALLTQMATDYVNMGVVKLQKASSASWSSVAAGPASPPPRKPPRPAMKSSWWKRPTSSAARSTTCPWARPCRLPGKTASPPTWPKRSPL